MRTYPVTSSLQRRKKRGGQAVTLESRAAFARRLGVARSTVTRAAQDGRLVLVGEEIDVEASLARWHATAGARSDVAARHAAQRGAPLPGASQPQGKPAEAPQEAASGLELPETPSDTGRARYKALALGATLRSAIERLIDQTAPRLAVLPAAERQALLAAEIAPLRRLLRGEFTRALRRIRQESRS